ncbi:hypothetical protein EVAR_27014_1 [Eumeta japonica]|uniref:Uncharacterized protein n=1 Tax=Eumeta variegata TaxID=151549 RepID=A0A4C1Z302_EUMVA|nr:hypothetical protein EVAR_27014_1 [Eumeta japonica]
MAAVSVFVHIKGSGPAMAVPSTRRPLLSLRSNAVEADVRVLLSSKQQKIDSEDDCDLYGKLLAKRLRQFTDLEKQELMYEIDGLLLKNVNCHIDKIPVVMWFSSQIIISTNRPVGGRTCTSTPLFSEEQNISCRPTSSLSTYSTSSYHPQSIVSPPYFSPSPNATPEEFPCHQYTRAA